MKTYNIKTWMRFMRLKWKTNATATQKLVNFSMEDDTIQDFDHHPMYGIDPKFRSNDSQAIQ